MFNFKLFNRLLLYRYITEAGRVNGSSEPKSPDMEIDVEPKTEIAEIFIPE